MKKSHLDYLKKAVNIAINLKDIADVPNQIMQLRNYRPPIYGMIRSIVADKRFYAVTENTPFWHRYALASTHDFIESITDEEWSSPQLLICRREDFLKTWQAGHSKPISREKVERIEKKLQEEGWSKPVAEGEVEEAPEEMGYSFSNYMFDRTIRDCTGYSLSTTDDPFSIIEKWRYGVADDDEENHNRQEKSQGEDSPDKQSGEEDASLYQGISAGAGNEPHEAERIFLRKIDPTLRKLAKMIGRSGQDISIEVRGRFQHSRRSDISGVAVGNDLNSVLPSELALLGNAVTEDIFYRKFTQKRLQVFSSSSVSYERSDTKKGAIFLCIDTSGSMGGEPEMMAKTLSLAIVIIAQRERRPVFVVNYSDDISFFILCNLERQRQHFMQFLRYSYGGGNNETRLFNFLFRLLPYNPNYKRFQRFFKNADLLVVSDFGWSPIDEDTVSVMKSKHEEGMKFYALGVNDLEIVKDPEKYIGRYGFQGADFLQLCDHRFTYSGGIVTKVK